MPPNDPLTFMILVGNSFGLDGLNHIEGSYKANEPDQDMTWSQITNQLLYKNI